MNPDRLRNIAYLCFLGLAASVPCIYLGELVGRHADLPQPVAAGLLVFVLLPLTFCGALAGLVGSILTVIVRRDARLYALSFLSFGLLVFWLRKDSHGADATWVLAYPVGVALFSLRWLWERRQQKCHPHGPPHPRSQGLMGENPRENTDGADRKDSTEKRKRSGPL
jgi:hypothetical protein